MEGHLYNGNIQPLWKVWHAALFFSFLLLLCAHCWCKVSTTASESNGNSHRDVHNNCYTKTVTQITNTNTEELSCGKHWACWQLPCAASSLPHSCWSFAALCGQWVDWIVQKCSTASLSPHHPPHHRQGAAIRPSHTAIQERFISLVWLCSVRSVFELQGLFLLKKKELQGWEQTVWSGNSAQLFPCKY